MKNEIKNEIKNILTTNCKNPEFSYVDEYTASKKDRIINIIRVVVESSETEVLKEISKIAKKQKVNNIITSEFIGQWKIRSFEIKSDKLTFTQLIFVWTNEPIAIYQNPNEAKYILNHLQKNQMFLTLKPKESKTSEMIWLYPKELKPNIDFDNITLHKLKIQNNSKLDLVIYAIHLASKRIVDLNLITSPNIKEFINLSFQS